MQRVLRGLALAATLAVSYSHGAEVVESDVCVYGGTSGGVIAAVQVARMDKSVVIVEFGGHLGGMSAGGLGATDTGNSAAIAGLSREFYRRVGRHYGQGLSFAFEPHVAERTFEAMVEEADIPVYYGQRLASVTKQGQRITEITMENGNVFRARMFIDASYEGDLMARAAVTYTFGREPNALYSETLNGVRGNTPAHQFVVNVDPYQTPGDPESGLLAYIQPGDGGAPGEGDQRIQAYNFRLCLTQNASNQVAIAAPAAYDEGKYELLARYIEARVAAGHTLNVRSFMNIAAMPNGKTDINNNGAFSTDFIGQNYDYPEGSYARREEIFNATLEYIQAFFYFLGNSARVPAAIRSEMLTWGLTQDEFQDNGGWPHQMYVREARRMVSDYVMTEHNCRGAVTAPKSIGLASYTMDSHNCQRIVQGGVARNEGDFQAPVPAPYPISYDAIVPARGQCENLFVTFCFSASHVAFGSMRMEPVFMILNQSAATAAAFAIDDNVAAQDVPYAKLRLQLLADQQLLEWGTTSVSTNAVVVDSEHTSSGATVVGAWAMSTSQSGYNGTNYLHDQNAGKGTKSVQLTPNLPQAGNYMVHLRWTANANRASNVPLMITHADGVTSSTVNQRANGSVWFALGTFRFEAGTAGSLLIETTGTDGFVIADAAMWLPATTPPTPRVEVIGSDIVAREDGPDVARFTVARSGDTSGSVTASYVLSGSAVAGSDYVQPAGAVYFAPGQQFVPVTITPVPDSLFEGDESVMLTLMAGAGYELGDYTNVSAVIQDGGFGLWRGNHFTSAELNDPAVSGESADPDSDGAGNLIEFFSGSNPKNSNAVAGLQLVADTNGWHIAWRRHEQAATLYIRIEHSGDLTAWGPAPFASQNPQIVAAPPYEMLRFPLGNLVGRAGFYRVAVSQTPLALTTNEAHLFFSFDTQTDGLGLFTDAVTANSGFYGTPSVSRMASATESLERGGALSFTDFTGTTWTGSGGASTPGHSLTFNPGSVNNELALSFSTIGLSQVRLRMDIRSAAQAGGTAPTRFTSFTYDIGGGPVPVPGANLTFVADNTFREWTADLSSLAIENQPRVTLRWRFEDLGASPQESMRFDNIQVSASP